MKFDFPNNHNEILSGRLELPVDEPVAYAVFAHCFTCSKDIIAPNTISKELTKKGIAVLRFDFTGLGNSQGDFSNTNFSSNVEDLLSACDELAKVYKEPEILIGHSLGGAAVLKATKSLPSIKAVATIGAPSNVEHVAHLFDNQICEIQKTGEAEVSLGGRNFTIKKQFIDDLKDNSILDHLGSLKKSLLVLHSPLDKTVSIDHAGKIFSAAKHPKSFVTLDNADHLLMNKTDAQYAANVIGSWALRYISSKEIDRPKIEKGIVSVNSRKNAKFTQDIFTKDHHIVADEPLSYKGNNLGMTPYDYLLAGLGACVSMTLKMYADRKSIDLDNVKVELKHRKIHADDCSDCENQTGKVDIIEKKIFLEGNISPEEKQRLFEIAEKCPVNRTLESDIKIESIKGN